MKAQTSLRIGTVSPGHTLYALTKCGIICTRGDQKIRGKVLLNRIAFIDFNENS